MAGHDRMSLYKGDVHGTILERGRCICLHEVHAACLGIFANKCADGSYLARQCDNALLRVFRFAKGFGRQRFEQ